MQIPQSKPHITPRSTSKPIQLLYERKRSYLMHKLKNKEENFLFIVPAGFFLAFEFFSIYTSNH